MFDYAQTTAAETSISAREATHHFSQYLEKTANGQSFVVMKHGKPMAKLVPVGHAVRTPKEEAERKKKIAKALSFRALRPYGGKFNRLDAYEDI